MCIPNRAYSYNKGERTSSLISQTLIIAPIAAWIWLEIVSTHGLAYRITMTSTAYVIVAFLKVLAGSIYPSDILLTLPISLANILMFQYIIDPTLKTTN
jgi:hypothetical protein